MENWLSYLKRGLSRGPAKDRIAGRDGYRGIKADLTNLRPFWSRHWRKGALGLFLILVAAVLSFPQPLIFRYLIDHVFLDRQLALLAGVILLLVGVGLAEKLATLLEQFYFARFEREVLLDIQHDLLEKALRFPKAFFDQNETGYLMSRLSSDIKGLRWFFSSTLVHVIGNLLRFLGGIVFLLYLEWRLALCVLVILPLVILIVRYFSGKIHALSYQSMEQEASVSSQLQESLSSMSLIKAFSSEMKTLSRLMSEVRAAFQISLEQSAVGSLANAVVNAMPGVARVLLLALGGYWVIQEKWSLGSLLAFQAYLGYVFGPAQFLSSANFQLQSALAALERVSALFDLVPEENLGTGQPVERLKGEVEFRNVSFSYADREPVLKGVSFSIRSGEHVAIVGPSGVGKTTLVSMILLFYKPTSGEIFFDGCPASDYEVGSLRRRIGYVSQNTMLLSGTVIENLRYGNPEAEEEVVFRAARIAAIHEFILGLPKGYQTEIGEKGVSLSEGEKQRLALARALVKDPDILVLDEPTSALDSVTEFPIFQSLPAFVREKTLFVVAHRLPTIKDSDRILLFNERRLVAMGNHESLLRTNEYYRSLVAHQQTNN